MTEKRKILVISLYCLSFCILGYMAWGLSQRRSSSSQPFSATSSSTLRPNIVLISLDTLRSDRLSSYGYKRKTSPFIDTLASQGSVFTNTTSVSSWTLPSHVSLFSGLYPSSHNITRDDQKAIGRNTPLLAEIFNEYEYRTFGFHGGGYVSGKFGFSRGFEKYENTELNVAGGRRIKKRNHGFITTLKKTQEELLNLKNGEPFFLFLHTFDIHCPYNPPEPYYSLFSSPEAEKIKTNKCGENFFNKLQLSEKQVQYVSDRYDGSIRWADKNLETFVNFLRDHDLYENTIFVLTSDHGEEFHEHGKIRHQASLHKELLRVPLIISGADITPGRHDEMVSLVDIAPTLLELASIPIPEEMQGTSLFRALKGDTLSLPTHRFAELDRQKTLRSYISSTDHLILDKSAQHQMYFDLETDENEQRNSYLKEDPKTQKLEEAMLLFEESLEKFETDSMAAKSKGQIENLKSLGYL